MTGAGTPAPSPTSVPPTSQPDVYSPEGQKWRDKYHGTAGYIEQLKRQNAEQLGQLQAQLDTAQEAVRQRDIAISSLNDKIQQLQGQVAGIPQLQQEIESLKKTAGLAGKYRLLAEYPEVLSVKVQEEQTAADGTKTTVEVNPLLTLIEHSALEGEPLRAEIGRLARFYRQPATPLPATPPGMPPIPTPATPVTQESAEHWYKLAMAEHDKVVG